jgi:hypothetical protein
MKRTIFGLASMLVVFVAVCAVLALRPVAKVKAAPQGCSPATLNGNYALVIKGVYGANDTLDFSMLLSFDGRGTFSGKYLNGVYDGALWAGSPETLTGGSYTVLPDCSCTLTTPSSSEVFDHLVTYFNGIIIRAGGGEVVGTLYSTWPLTGTFDAKKVTE